MALKLLLLSACLATAFAWSAADYITGQRETTVRGIMLVQDYTTDGLTLTDVEVTVDSKPFGDFDIGFDSVHGTDTHVEFTFFRLYALPNTTEFSITIEWSREGETTPSTTNFKFPLSTLLKTAHQWEASSYIDCDVVTFSEGTTVKQRLLHRPLHVNATSVTLNAVGTFREVETTISIDSSDETVVYYVFPDLQGLEPTDFFDICTSWVTGYQALPSVTCTSLFVYQITETAPPSHFIINVVLLVTAGVLALGAIIYYIKERKADKTNGNLL